MGQVAVAIGIMTGLGVFFAVVLAIAYRFLRVDEDPRIEQVNDLLPGNNCGACGFPGCAAFAEKLVGGTYSPSKCTVASGDTLEAIATFLGVDVGEQAKDVARLKCAGGEGLVQHLAGYEGIATCRAAVIVDGGHRACPWGCLGLGDCDVACTFDAITMNALGLPEVDPEACTACGDCVDACPLDLFVIVPMEHRLFVQCNSPLTGEAARARCAVACDGCGLCAADAPPGVIEIVDGLPRIRYDAEFAPNRAATLRCPTGAIQWLEGRQFAEPEEELYFRRKYA